MFLESLWVSTFRLSTKKGSGNKIVDVLSCVHHIAIIELAAMFFAQPSQLSDLHNFYTTDPTTSILLAELALHSPLDQYTLLNGIIRYKQRICLDILPTFSTIKWYYLLQTMHLLGTFYPPSACIPLSLLHSSDVSVPQAMKLLTTEGRSLCLA
jgi:hypothetical protein